MKNIYKKFLFSVVALLIFSFKGFSTHIVGGALTYTYNGGTNYTIMLKLYRDCSGAAFPATAPVTVRQADGSPFAVPLDFTLPGGTISNIPLVLPPCATSPSVVPCVQERIYTATVSLPASPGGMHLYYSVIFRNPSIVNIVNPGGVGETFYCFIPCFRTVWSEDFTLANGTTVDAGPTAWTRTINVPAPLPTAQVNNGQFEIISQSSGSAGHVIWASQVIPINTFTAGVNLSVNYSDPVGNTLENSDSIKVFYSINGGAKVLFPVNGQRVNDFDASVFSTATGLLGNTIQVFIRTAFGTNSPNDERYNFDMVNVYNNSFLANSNPAFPSLPPLLFCSTNTFNINHSATDIDGDSLAYTMYTPYIETPPTFNNNTAVFTPVAWVGGYSATSPFNPGGPGVTLTPTTGIMTGAANSNGSYVFGVKCSEYRNGVLLSEMVRDYQVTAVTCPPFIPSAPGLGANGGGTLCAGQNLSLTATFTAGATYSWTGPNSFTANVQNPVIVATTTAATGTYSCAVTVTGCTGPAGTIAIVINPIPTAPVAAGNTPICSGQTLSLTATFSAGATYNWNGPNSFTSTAQNPTIAAISLAGSGTYSVTRTLSGCTSPAGTVAIVVNPTPSAPAAGANTPLCAGQTLSLTSTFTAGATYNWTGPNSFTSAVQNPTIASITLAGSGVYSVNATIGGCPGPIGTISVTVNPAPSAPTAGANTPLCVGQTLSLTSTFTAGATYNWSGPNGFTSASQNPTIAAVTLAASGVYSVNATIAGCPGPTGTISVTVNPIPSAPTAGANTPLCAGLTLSLTSTFTAGATYNWNGPNSFTSSVQNPTIGGATPLATGIYTVSATIAGCTGPVGTISVNVSTQPSAPVTGANTPLCVGQTLSLTATFTAGLTYSWTGPNAFTSNLQNPTIAGITLAGSGNYSVFATTAGGCSGPVGTISVTINPAPSAPTAGANTPLCVGQTLSLTASFTAGATYNWTGPNTFTSNVQNPTIGFITLAGSGNYSVSATVAGCPGPIGTISVTVNPTPIAPTLGANSPLCVGQTLSLTSSFTVGNTYNWTGPNTFTSNLQNPTIAAITLAGSGVYSVSATKLGCTGPSGTISVTVNPIPAIPTAGANSPICALQTLSLTANPGGATYSWTGPNSFTSTSQNPTIPSPTVNASGTYSVTQTLLGCTSPAGTVAVTVNLTPAAPTAGGTATLCSGSTVSLTANPGGASYSWTGPNGFTSLVQNPTIPGASTLATGMYSVTATIAGCTGPAGTFSVNVFGSPSPPPLGSNSPLCTGQTLSLTAGFIAGASYAWTGPNGFNSAVQNPTLGAITLAGAGNYSLNVNVSGCGSAGTVIAVVVNPTPAAPTAASNSSICSGSNLNLTANPGGGTYSWIGPNSFTSTSQNPTIAGATTLATGMYSVTITLSGCTSAAGTTSVTVNPIPSAPTAGSNSTLCAGQTLSLTANPGGATYIWSGPNSFTSAVQNPTIGVVTTSASGTYSVTQTLLGCTGPAGIVNVTVNPIPAIPTPGSNSPICALQTLSLTANPAGATYSWTGPNSFTSTIQNPTIGPASTLAAGNYSLTQTLLGCTSSPAVLGVTINPAAATPTAGSNSPICLGQNINFTQTPIVAATYSWAGPNSFTSSVQNPTVVGASTLATGVYSIFATVAGCSGLTTTLSVLVSNPGTVSAGTNTVCANNATVALTGTSSTGSGTWTSSGSGTFSPNSINGNYIPSPAEISAGTATLTLTSTNNGGCVPVTTTTSIFITPAPTASAGGNQTVCANNATVSLSGSVTIAAGGTWSSSGTGTFFPNNAVLNASYVPSPADISAGSFTLTLTTTGNGNCFAVTNTKVIFISPSPIVNPGNNPQVVCKNNPNFQLNGSSTTGSVTWVSSGTGSFSPNNNLLNPTYVPSTADTLAGTVTLTITSTNNGGCNAVSATMSIVYVSTLAVNAGTDQTVCSNNPSVALNGVSTTSAGIWTSSGTGTFNPSASSLITNYLPSPADIIAGIVNLTLTTTNNGGCNPIFDVMTITITPGPTANAGPSQTVCANNATVALTGSFTIAGGAIWSTSGSGTFAPNNTTMNVNYIASPADTTAGSVIITLSTTSNGNCFATTSTMVINFTPAPLLIAPNISVCKNNPIAVISGSSSTGSGTWTTSGTGTFTPNNAVLNPTYTPSTADTTAGSVTLTLTSTNNGGCNPVTQTMTITFSGIPTITAGISQTVCANNANVILTGTTSTGSGTWTSSGTGIFAPNTYTGTYVPSGPDITGGSVTLTLTSTNNGGCLPVTQQMQVNFTPAPQVNAGSNQTICANTTSVNLNGSFTIATGATWSSSGTGTFTPNNTNMTVDYIPSSADTTAGSVLIFLTSTGNGNCLQVVDTLLIDFTSSPFVNAGSNFGLCPNAADPLLNGISSTGSGTWTTLGSGIFSPNNTTLNPTYTPSNGDHTAGTVTLVLNSGVGTCGSSADTLVLTFLPAPLATFNYTNRCVGSTTGFTNTSISVPTGTVISWLWHFNTDTTTVKDPFYAFGSSGNQSVSLVVSNGVCTDSIFRTLFINPNPTPAYTFTTLCHDSVQFVQSASVTPGGISNWNWDFGDVSTSVVQNPFHVYADTGVYVVTLQVISDSSCVASIVDTVHVTKCSNDVIVLIGEPAVPSGFTPNGDGSNDVLFVKGGPFTSLDFRIFNEWGNQIFRSDIQSSGWDGTYKSAMQPVGRFIWTVTGELIDGRQVKMAGETILNR